MSWSSASEFFAMGGYGLYVWGAYAVTAAYMLAEPVLAVRRHRQARLAAGAGANAAGGAGDRR